MYPAKRLEIVSDSVELTRILDALDQATVPYTVIRNVAGRGIGGTMFDDSAVTMVDNAYVIAFCSPEKVEIAIEKIRPILNRFGGSCWISDAMEIRSVRCISS